MTEHSDLDTEPGVWTERIVCLIGGLVFGPLVVLVILYAVKWW